LEETLESLPNSSNSHGTGAPYSSRPHPIIQTKGWKLSISHKPVSGELEFRLPSLKALTASEQKEIVICYLTRRQMSSYYADSCRHINSLERIMSPSLLPKLTDAEFEIMAIVWEEGETTVNHVWETINRKRQAPLSRTTILVQMNRLEEKRWLKHRALGRTFYYCSTRKRDETLETFVGDIHDRLFKGSSSDLVRCLFKSVKVSKTEIRKLKEIINSQKGEPE
jgi:BlaI family penicillinase repressor